MLRDSGFDILNPMTNRSEYVRTGNNRLTSLANALSFIPVFGATLSVPVGIASSLLDAGKWLVRGKIGSAATEIVTGTTSTIINGVGASSLYWWLGKAGTVVGSGHTLGTHG